MIKLKKAKKCEVCRALAIMNTSCGIVEYCELGFRQHTIERKGLAFKHPSEPCPKPLTRAFSNQCSTELRDRAK